MKSKKYLRTVVSIVAVVLALVLVGCGGGVEFTYRVGGTASEAKVAYTNADGEIEEATVSLPWETTLKVSNEFSFEIAVRNTSDTGTVTCEVLADERELGEADGYTFAKCSGSFTKRGGSFESNFHSEYDAPPTLADEHIKRGIEYVEQGRLDEAIAEFEEAIKINPDDAKAHYNLGLTYDNQGRLDEAIAEYKEAIRLNPDDANAHLNLGVAYADQGQLEEAIAEYQEAIRIHPDYANAHFNLGLAYDEQGRTEEAIAEYQEAIRINPDDADAHLNLGVAYKKQGRFDEAIAEYQEALRINPDYALVHLNLGVAYADQGQLEEAIAEYQEAIRIHPDYANAHFNLGLAYREQGRTEEAIAEFETYLQLRPDASNRAEVEEEIERLKEQAAGAGAEYRNAAGGYSLLYPEGWYYTESGTQVEFAESEEALKVAGEETVGILFNAGPLADFAENVGLPADTSDPVVVWEAIADLIDAEGEGIAVDIASYPAAASNVSSIDDDTPFEGGIAVVLVEERLLYCVAVAPPDQWETFRSTFVDMVVSLSFFEPQE